MKRKIGILLLTVTAAAAMAAGLAACTSSDGASAYDLAVANGYSGTEAQWLESLKGDDGTTGATGATGTGIESVALNKYNDLVVTYTDETSTTLKYHGTIANPYQIYSGIYEAAYSDTYGYVSFLEEDYITVAAGETIYVSYILEEASNLYIGADGIDAGDITLTITLNDGTDKYTTSTTEDDWLTEGTVVYNSLGMNTTMLEYYGDTYTFAITNNSEEEVAMMLGVGEYSLSLGLDKTVGTTLTTDSNYASATFTATTTGWYEFTLTGDGKTNVYAFGYDDSSDYAVYLNHYRFNPDEYSYIAYIPTGVTIYFTCAMLDYDIASSTFAISVAETTIDSSLAISSSGLTTTALEGSEDLWEGTTYTYYVTETGYYTFTATAATTGTAAVVEFYESYNYDGAYLSPDSTVTITVDEEETTIADEFYGVTTSYSLYLAVGWTVTIDVYYDAIVTVATATPDLTLSSSGLTATELEETSGSQWIGTTYVVYIANSGTYTISIDDAGDLVMEGVGSDYTYESLYTGSQEVELTLEAGTYYTFTVYADTTVTVTYSATAAE